MSDGLQDVFEIKIGGSSESGHTPILPLAVVYNVFDIDLIINKGKCWILFDYVMILFEEEK